nr:MAG TPA: hypothetical protein [Caudoviricetes sp.]
MSAIGETLCPLCRTFFSRLECVRREAQGPPPFSFRGIFSTTKQNNARSRATHITKLTERSYEKWLH